MKNSFQFINENILKKILNLNIVMFLVFPLNIFSQVKIYIKSDTVKSSKDSYKLNSFELFSNKSIDTSEKAMFFYIQGSGCISVIEKVDYLASAIIMGGRAIVAEKRGCYPDRINKQECFKYYDKNTRVSDHLDVINFYTNDLKDGTPIILIGGSEGGDVAAKIASLNNKVTHLILIGSGGGISQIEEFKLLMERNTNYLGLESQEGLNDKVEEIESSEVDNELWAGLPYKRWRSFWDEPSINYLKDLKIPILVLHGEKDNNVPIESARILNEKLKKTNDLSYVEYENLDHSFNDITDNKSRYPYLEIDIIKWLEKYKIISNEHMEKFIKRVRKRHKKIFKSRK